MRATDRSWMERNDEENQKIMDDRIAALVAGLRPYTRDEKRDDLSVTLIIGPTHYVKVSRLWPEHAAVQVWGDVTDTPRISRDPLCQSLLTHNPDARVMDVILSLDSFRHSIAEIVTLVADKLSLKHSTDRDG